MLSMIAVNSDAHSIFFRMHRPNDEKRAVASLNPNGWEERLATLNVEAAQAMLQGCFALLC
ncbi:hypothetical protein [Burkholderia stabilis]|uniref:Uncharacterized protein n=1 Tax=Burkholderia stabilis TaxID=95485 RepID=A0AAJ5N959_9BURK|nr:hypothetical protein [Burkholderia stabilis]VBB10592.1 hypothetical protein BSTAB16_0699 [Burkholderia stabilis]